MARCQSLHQLPRFFRDGDGGDRLWRRQQRRNRIFEQLGQRALHHRIAVVVDVAAIRRQADVAVGNVIGSNLFNILAVMGG